jgi:hypothetical protein
MLQQKILRYEGLGSSRPEKQAQAARQLKKQDQDMPHPGSLPQSSASASGQPDSLNSRFANSPPIATNSLTGGASYFSDPKWTNYPARFYRVKSQEE